MTEKNKKKTESAPAEHAPEKGGRLRRAAISGGVLLAVLAIVVLAAYHDGTGFDFLRRWLTYGTAEQADSYRYDAAGSNRFAILGDGMAVLSGTELRILGGDGTVRLSKPVNFRAPALAAAGDLAVAYDVGGSILCLVNAAGEILLELKQPAERPIIAASVNKSGYLAVTAEKAGCKGCVSVYDRKQTLIFEFNSVERFVTDARVAEDGRTVTAVTLGQENGEFLSSMVVYDLKQTEPKAAWDVPDGVVLGLDERSGRQIAVCDTAIACGGIDGTVHGTYGFGGAYLRGWAVGEDYAVLQLNRFSAGSLGRIVTVGLDGSELASLDVSEEIVGISAAGRYIAVLYAGRLVIYTPQLLEYARLENVDRAKGVLMCGDGSALVLESEQANRFLP